jgi:hypothetical protein
MPVTRDSDRDGPATSLHWQRTVSAARLTPGPGRGPPSPRAAESDRHGDRAPSPSPPAREANAGRGGVVSSFNLSSDSNRARSCDHCHWHHDHPSHSTGFSGPGFPPPRAFKFRVTHRDCRSLSASGRMAPSPGGNLKFNLKRVRRPARPGPVTVSVPLRFHDRRTRRLECPPCQ